MNLKYVHLDNNDLHNEIVKVSKELRRAETNLIELLGIANDRKLFIKFECASIYAYAEKYLELKYQKAHDFLMLYNASKKIPELKEEIKKAEIGYTKLRAVLPALEVKIEEKKRGDIKDLIEKTKVSSRRELEIMVRDIAPVTEVRAPEPVYLGKGKIKRTAILTNEQEVLLNKAMLLLSGEMREDLTFEKFLELASRKIIEHKLKSGNKKAAIVIEKNSSCTKSFGDLKVDKEKLITSPGGDKKKGIPQKIKAEVIKRDSSKCQVCGKSHGISIHHIKPQYENGGNEASNLLILCTSCHSLVHQKYLDIRYENNEFKTGYIDGEIKTITDLIFKQKREAYLREKYSEKPAMRPLSRDNNLILIF